VIFRRTTASYREPRCQITSPRRTAPESSQSARSRQDREITHCHQSQNSRQSPKITHDAWVRRVITWELTGDTPRDLRLAWSIDAAGRAALEQEIFGKHVLITDHDDWTAAEVIAGYRSQAEAEFSFRQMKDPHLVSFSPMFHWTEHNIRVHVLTCVLALQIAHLMRLQAQRAGLRMSVRELLTQLAGIGETILIYPAARGRPKARRMLTETTSTQDKLIQVFQLDRLAPKVRS